jgi:hypothetical protein
MSHIPLAAGKNPHWPFAVAVLLVVYAEATGKRCGRYPQLCPDGAEGAWAGIASYLIYGCRGGSPYWPNWKTSGEEVSFTGAFNRLAPERHRRSAPLFAGGMPGRTIRIFPEHHHQGWAIFCLAAYFPGYACPRLVYDAHAAHARIAAAD